MAMPNRAGISHWITRFLSMTCTPSSNKDKTPAPAVSPYSP
jgi:hypothetical protein